MTKAKARIRAKARAAAKVAGHETKAAKPQSKQRKGYFDAKSENMRHTGSGADIRTKGGMPRGAARSR